MYYSVKVVWAGFLTGGILLLYWTTVKSLIIIAIVIKIAGQGG
jgi:hypothetical protein